MENEIPRGWVWTTIGEIAETTSGGTPARNHPDYYTGSIFWIKSGELNDGMIDQSEETISELGLKNSNAKFFPPGTVLIAMYGATIGRTGILRVEATTNQAICSILPLHNIFIPKFVFYWLQSQKDYLIGHSFGGAQHNINQGIIRNLSFPLPPFPEQQRIVEAIEQQFSRLDAAVALLRQAQKKLKLYRSSVLKAAVEGELTAEWRAAHPDSEPASELLKRILAERQAKWEEEQLAKMREKGIVPKDDKWKQAYQEPQGPDVNSLSELPRGWSWARAEQLCDFITKGTTPAADKLYNETGDIPFIKVYNLTHNGHLDFSIKPTFIDKYTHMHELSRSKTFPGDILMNIVGPPLGKVSVVPDTYTEWNINQAIAIFRPMPSYDRKCLLFSLLAEGILTWAIRRAKTTAGQHNLTLEICRDLPLPLPSLAEQEQIVSLVEEHMSIINELETTIEKALKQAVRQRQSILHQAFTGKLVPQDPNDEPASVLLERIQQERQREQQEKPKTQRVQPKTVRSKKTPRMTKAVQIPDRPVEPIDVAGLTQGNLWEQEMDEVPEEQETIEHDLRHNVEA